MARCAVALVRIVEQREASLLRDAQRHPAAQVCVVLAVVRIEVVRALLNDLLYATTASATTLPPQTATDIGDLLTAKNVTWTWYGGSWNAAVADGTRVASAAAP